MMKRLGLALIHLALASSAFGATLVDMDLLLIRHHTHDELVCRPWTAGAERDCWLGTAPHGATVRLDPSLAIMDLKTAVWQGHAPLSRVNRRALDTLCEMVDYSGETVPEATLVGPFATIAELETHLLELEFDPDPADLAALPTDEAVYAVVWEPPELLSAGDTVWSPDKRPLPAVVIEPPTRFERLPVTWNVRGRGCVGTAILAATAPLVDDPDAPGEWDSSLLKDLPAAQGLPAVTVLSLNRCDEAVELRPVPLDPERDLAGRHARTAASWYGLHPWAVRPEVLRAALADTSRTDQAVAYLIWAYSQQGSDDLETVLAPWLTRGDDLARSEARAALHDPATSDGALAILAAGASGLTTQRLVNRAGWQLMAEAEQRHVPALRALVDSCGVWWYEPDRATRGHRLGHEDLSPGQWASAVLARLGDPASRDCIVEALVRSGRENVAQMWSRRAGPGLQNGMSPDFWNGMLILQPRETQRLWPTLYRVTLAFETRSAVRDTLFRAAIRHDALPGEARTVLLAGLSGWTGQDATMTGRIFHSLSGEPRRLMTRSRSADGSEILDRPIHPVLAGVELVLALRGMQPPPGEDTGEHLFALALSLDPAAAAAIRTRIDAEWNGVPFGPRVPLHHFLALARYQHVTGEDVFAGLEERETLDGLIERHRREIAFRFPFIARADFEIRPFWLR